MKGLKDKTVQYNKKQENGKLSIGENLQDRM
jgi:hypothetical protein